MTQDLQTRQRVLVKTLGCKVNQCESEAILSALTVPESGFIPGDAHRSDVVIVNTCAVTARAAMQSRQTIRQVIRSHPDAFVVVTGCHAQTSPETVSAIDGVARIVKNSDKLRIPHMLLDQTPAPDTAGDASFMGIPGIGPGSRTRPTLKIQDGCDAFCTYCIVPYARGRSRSMPVDQVMAGLSRLAQAGAKEVVLTGIHVGCYGQDLSPPTDLGTLLCRVLEKKDIPQVRLSSIEPAELSDAVIDLAAAPGPFSGKLCPHFHIPLQSGDNDILARMHRPYSREFFKERVHAVVARIPDAAIGVDVLVGFPGETDAAFDHTYTLIEALPVAYLHVFPFSPRKGTPAFSFKPKVPEPVIKARCEHLRQLGERKRHEFYGRQMGKTVTILVEAARDKKTGLLKGFTGNYVPVCMDGPDLLFNTFQNIYIAKMADGILIGHQRF